LNPLPGLDGDKLASFTQRVNDWIYNFQSNSLLQLLAPSDRHNPISLAEDFGGFCINIFSNPI